MRIALALLLVLASAAPAGAITVRNDLTVTRPDGTEVAYAPRVRVFCGAWEPGVPERAIHVVVGRRASGPYWKLSGVLADVAGGRVVPLPNAFNFDAPSGALLFATDGDNELSSAEEEARGRITFDHARCGPDLRVRVRIRATLGSELSDLPRMRVRGTFSAAK
jgi:hypothetical protein